MRYQADLAGPGWPNAAGREEFDDVPGDAASEPDLEKIVRGSVGLRTLFPRLAAVDGLQVGCYAGYRQDIGDLPGNRLCELVDGTQNVIMALPSGLIGPWLNVTSISDIVGGLVDPGGNQPPLPGGGADVRVGSAVEDRPDFVWMGWEDWLRTYPQLSEHR